MTLATTVPFVEPRALDCLARPFAGTESGAYDTGNRAVIKNSRDVLLLFSNFWK
jgi:hypothetical protein